jgi:hypothetical protein
MPPDQNASQTRSIWPLISPVTSRLKRGLALADGSVGVEGRGVFGFAV